MLLPAKQLRIPCAPAFHHLQMITILSLAYLTFMPATLPPLFTANNMPALKLPQHKLQTVNLCARSAPRNILTLISPLSVRRGGFETSSGWFLRRVARVCVTRYPLFAPVSSYMYHHRTSVAWGIVGPL